MSKGIDGRNIADLTACELLATVDNPKHRPIMLKQWGRARTVAILHDLGVTDTVYISGMSNTIADILVEEPEMLFPRLTIDAGMSDDTATWICQALGF